MRTKNYTPTEHCTSSEYWRYNLDKSIDILKKIRVMSDAHGRYLVDCLTEPFSPDELAYIRVQLLDIESLAKERLAEGN